MTTSSQVFTDELNNITSTFSSILSEYVPTLVNYQIDSTNTAFSSSYDSLTSQLSKCSADLATLDTQVLNDIQSANNELSQALASTTSTTSLADMIPSLFEKNYTSMDMRMNNIKLYSYQILLNWEMFFGMIFIFICFIFYYRKYYNTKELIEYTKQKMSDVKEDVSNNIKDAKEVMTTLSEPPSETTEST